MADWKQIPDTDVDPDAPVTSELMYALRDNPVAIAEGAVGAPRIEPYSLLTGYIGTVDTSGNNVVSFIDLRPVSSIIVRGGTIGVTNQTLQVSLSTNNGGTWGNWSSVASGTLGASDIRVESVINTITGSINTVCSAQNVVQAFSLPVSVPSGKVNAVRFRGSSSSTALLLRFLVFIDGGQP